MKKPKILERNLLRPLLDFLDLVQARGDLVYLRFHPVKPVSKGDKIIFTPVRATQKGVADVIILPKYNPPRALAVEVKATGKKQSEDQIEWQKEWEATGSVYMVMDSTERLDFIIKLLSR